MVATGAEAEFGNIAAGLSGHQLETEFQVGLRRFSMLLVYVAGALTTSIFFEWSLSQQPEHGGPARSVPDPHSSDTAAVVVTSWTTSPLL
ncbi:hypothetical protein [Streptomyces sp. NBC_00557]|uniref:hypothetical protein n=1 Tax=Streptomyces sp. NBC_00557 TaxID=2975776 RepID=UPI002E823300|nr:hypothetical protein [Streptomyces sp. NBC_00557]WUC40133.1 hypothetical protein OG956_37370 [Streptomyces sp. NBC_00557]